MNRILGILICSILLINCDNQKEQVGEMETSVLQIHDQIMENLPELTKLEKILVQKLELIDSLENEGINGNNLAQNRLKLLELSKNIKDSNEQMMLWMQHYNGDSARSLPAEAAITYFQIEKERLISLKLTTEKNLTDSRSFITNNYGN